MEPLYMNQSEAVKHCKSAKQAEQEEDMYETMACIPQQACSPQQAQNEYIELQFKKTSKAEPIQACKLQQQATTTTTSPGTLHPKPKQKDKSKKKRCFTLGLVATAFLAGLAAFGVIAVAVVSQVNHQDGIQLIEMTNNSLEIALLMVSEEIKQLRIESEDMSVLLNEALEEISHLRAENDNMSILLNTTIEVTQKGIMNNITALAAQQLSLNDQVNLLNGSLELMVASLNSSFNAQLAIAQEQLSSIGDNVTAQSNQLVGFNSSFNAQLAIAQEQLSSIGDNVTVQSNKLVSVNDSFNAQLVTAQEQLSSIGDNVAAQSNQLVGFNNSFNAQLAMAQEQLSSISDNVTVQSNQLVGFNNSFNAQLVMAQEQLSSISDNVATQSNQLGSVNESVNALGIDQATTQGQLVSLDGEISNLDNRHNLIRNDLNTLTTSFMNLSVAVHTPEELYQSCDNETYRERVGQVNNIFYTTVATPSVEIASEGYYTLDVTCHFETSHSEFTVVASQKRTGSGSQTVCFCQLLRLNSTSDILLQLSTPPGFYLDCILTVTRCPLTLV